MNAFPTPSIDWAALTPELVLLGGAAVCMLVALFLPAAWARRFSAFAAAGCLLGAGAAAIVLFTMDDTASGVVAARMTVRRRSGHSDSRTTRAPERAGRIARRACPATTPVDEATVW